MKTLSDMALVKTSDEIDLTSWEIFYLRPKLGRRISAFVQSVFEAEPPELTLPFQWSGGEQSGDGYRGQAVTDPMMLYVALPLAKDDKVVFSCSLEEAIDYVFQGFSSTGEADGPIVSEEHRNVLAQMAVRLLELANKIDEALERSDSD
jgi:hypothetical protein